MIPSKIKLPNFGRTRGQTSVFGIFRILIASTNQIWRIIKMMIATQVKNSKFGHRRGQFFNFGI